MKQQEGEETRQVNLWKFEFQDESGEKLQGERKLEFDLVGVTEDRKKLFIKCGGGRLGLLDLGTDREVDVRRLAILYGMDIPIYREDTSTATDGTPVTELKLVEIIHQESEEGSGHCLTASTN